MNVDRQDPKSRGEGNQQHNHDLQDSVHYISVNQNVAYHPKEDRHSVIDCFVPH